MIPQVILHSNDCPPKNLSHARPVLCIHSEHLMYIDRAATQHELWGVLNKHGGGIIKI